jgi:RNA polymerase sigma-70 factor (ECF subfamily)
VTSPPLARAAAAARVRWPEIAFSDEDFARHLQAAAVSDSVTAERGEELFLAAACAAAEPGALRALERDYLAGLGAYVGARFHVTDAFLDELRQAVRLRLIFDRPPRITGYRGTGTLRAFIRVVSVRLALDLVEARGRQPALMDPEMIARRFGASPAVESQLTRAEHGPRFQAAIEEAVVQLTAREKAVLRFHFVEGLNIEAIGRIYRVHRATVARWLVDIRGRIFRAVEQRMAIELEMSPSEFRSLVGLMRDELKLSFSRVLAADHSGGRVKRDGDGICASPARGRR